MITVTKDTPVDQLIAVNSDIVKLLVREGLPCVVCGEPFWGSLEDLARQKKWTDEAIAELVEKIRAEITKAG